MRGQLQNHCFNECPVDARVLRPTTPAIAAQLVRILQSEELTAMPAERRLLRYIVERGVLGQRGSRGSEAFADRAFGVEHGLDWVEQKTVRLVGKRLKAALARYYAANAGNADVVIELDPETFMPKFSYRSYPDVLDPRQKAIMWCDAYAMEMSQRLHTSALRAVEYAMRFEAEDADLLSRYAWLKFDACTLGYGARWTDIDGAQRSLDHARTLAPADGYVMFVSGLMALERGELREVARCGRALLDTGIDQPMLFRGAWLVDLTIDPSDDKDALLTTSFQSSLDYPGLARHPVFLRSYRQGLYEDALLHGLATGMPNFFWAALERAAALARLGLDIAAGAQVDVLQRLNPAFANQPRRFLRSFIPYQDTLEQVFEGLAKAGLRSPSTI